uniref:Sushi domain-containing protein n=2 Tax=Echeneis naucrates TaxID=173247 RepID=A0A665W3T0_ECHNA
MKLCWNVLLFCVAALVSAKPPRFCQPPHRQLSTRVLGEATPERRFAPGEKVLYKCQEGYTPDGGSPAAECQGGIWRKPTLECRRICDPPGELLNGKYIYDRRPYLRTKAYATCNEGYMLKGPNFIVCKKSGWVGKLPSCKEVTVKGITCSSPAVANSVRSGKNVSVYQAGDDVIFRCNKGFQLVGVQHVTCRRNGKWHPELPHCKPSPVAQTEQPPPTEGPAQTERPTEGPAQTERPTEGPAQTERPTEGPEPTEAVRCGVPPNVYSSHADLADEYITRKSFAEGERVAYACNTGYTPNGSKFRTCKNGKWTPLYLTCKRRSCGSAGDILYGEFVYTGALFGDSATAVCDEGFRVVGQATRYCQAQGWDGRTPVCEAMVCEDPPEVANAKIHGLQETYRYRAVVRYQCLDGVPIGEREIWCTADGTWSGTPPKCNAEMTCSRPDVPEGFWMGSYREQYRDRETLRIECQPGYRLSGTPTIRCNRGQWLPYLPKCQYHYDYYRRY